MEKQLESINIVSFIINGMLSIRLLTLPREIVEYANNNGWVSVILIGGYTYFIGYSFYWIGKRHKNLNYSQICERLFGKLIGKLIIVGIGIYTLASIGLGLRMFGDSIKVYLLDTTPLTIIISIMILAILYCMINGIKTISIILDVFLPFILLFTLFLAILSLNNIDIMHLRPFFYGGIKPITLGALEVADPFLTVGIIGYILPYFKNFNKMKMYIGVSITISILIYFTVVILCILAFGSDEVQFLLFPTITLSKSIRLDIKILERAESLFMAVWIPITFTTLLLFYLASTLNLKALFNSKKDRLIMFYQIPIFFFIALYPENISEVFRYMNYNEKLGQVLIFAIVPLSVIIQLLKERRKTIEKDN